MGDARFTAGIIWQMVTKAKYACSFAVHDPILESTARDEIPARQQIKTMVDGYYNHEYNRQAPNVTVSEQTDSSSLDVLVGTKRPINQWEQKSYKDMHSFYAGKVSTPQQSI
jgi:hypothetical protein